MQSGPSSLSILGSIKNKGLISADKQDDATQSVKSADVGKAKSICAIYISKEFWHVKNEMLLNNRNFGLLFIAMERAYNISVNDKNEFIDELQNRLRQNVVLVFASEAVSGAITPECAGHECNLSVGNRAHLKKVICPSELKDIAASIFADTQIEIIEVPCVSVELSHFSVFCNTRNKLQLINDSQADMDNEINNKAESKVNKRLLDKPELMNIKLFDIRESLKKSAVEKIQAKIKMTFTFPDYHSAITKLKDDLSQDFAVHLVRLPTERDSRLLVDQLDTPQHSSHSSLILK